ncbi:hypothetical protein QF046_002988 [Microbacterium sp. W4I4]|uniref:hypothetical protein n=1 Tax=Microbacterium sp. W4I4 TaxID=3042295 RepID=UPI002789AC7F|nr:hypothetical protein [Microbacterium sp. W4I4]MDQ0615347.1 hypothetical protein [Microbacterium sp. W4I4]
MVDSDRGDDVAFQTGNEDNIVPDLLGWFDIVTRDDVVSGRFSEACPVAGPCGLARGGDWSALERVMSQATIIMEANAAVFDVRGGFAGFTAGANDVLRRQGLLEGADASTQMRRCHRGKLN